MVTCRRYTAARVGRSVERAALRLRRGSRWLSKQSPCILISDFHRRMNTDFWFSGFYTVYEVNFQTFRDPQRLPKGRRKIYLAHRAKSLKPKMSDSIDIVWWSTQGQWKPGRVACTGGIRNYTCMQNAAEGSDGMRHVRSIETPSVRLGFSIVPRLRTGVSRGWFPGGARDRCVLQNLQTGSGPYPVSYSVGTAVFFPLGVKWPGREGEFHVLPGLKIIQLPSPWALIAWKGQLRVLRIRVLMRDLCNGETVAHFQSLALQHEVSFQQ